MAAQVWVMWVWDVWDAGVGGSPLADFLKDRWCIAALTGGGFPGDPVSAHMLPGTPVSRGERADRGVIAGCTGMQ